jgi:hypothetical protein
VEGGEEYFGGYIHHPRMFDPSFPAIVRSKQHSVVSNQHSVRAISLRLPALTG